MTLKKTYLTIDEIGNIIQQMSNYSNSYEQEMIKIVLIAKYCLDEDFTDMTDMEVYNYVAGQDFYLTLDNITNYYDLCRLIKEQFGLDRSVREFLISLDEKIDKLSTKIPNNFNLETISKMLRNKNENK